MQHVFVFLLVACITVGLGTFILAFSLFFRGKSALERLFLGFLGFFTARMLSDTVVFYLFPLLSPSGLVLYLVMLLGRVTLAGAIGLLVFFVHTLTGIFQSKRSTVFFAVGLGLFFLFFIGEYLLRHSFPSIGDFYAFSIENFVVICIVLYPAVMLIAFSRRIKDRVVYDMVRRSVVLIVVLMPLIVVEDLFSSSGLIDASLKLFPLYYLVLYCFLLVQGFRHLVASRKAVGGPHGVRDEFVARFGITEREREILLLMIEGATNKEIGGKLFISAATVRNHLHNIFEKTGAANRIELLRMATD